MLQEINNHWFGVLTVENIDAVAAAVRKMLRGRLCIAEALYCDSAGADLRIISPDCVIDSQWASEPSRESVRVFADGGHKWFGFFAGDYLWIFDARSDGRQDHEDYRYPYFVFEHDRFTVTERAPAGKGYLHKRAFGAHRTEAEDES